MKWVRRGMPVLIIAALVWFLVTDTDDLGGRDGAETAASARDTRVTTSSPRRYRAEWVVNALAAGRQDPDAPYIYVEMIDDPNGRTLVQTATHLAFQDLESAAICAAIFSPEEQTSCASVARPDQVPNVASIAVTALRDWSPAGVFEVAGQASMRAAAARDPEAWTMRGDDHRGVPVDCFAVVRDTPTAPTGFDICYTRDGNGLIATLDLTGDELLEVDLQLYTSQVSSESFELAYDIPVDPTIYEQLVFIHPQIPVVASGGGSDDPEDQS